MGILVKKMRPKKWLAAPEKLILPPPPPKIRRQPCRRPGTMHNHLNIFKFSKNKLNFYLLHLEPHLLLSSRAATNSRIYYIVTAVRNTEHKILS